MKLPETLADKALKEMNKAISDKFLNEWNPDQFKIMERAISRHFSYKPMETLHGNYTQMYRGFDALDKIMGLAYTSSSSYAGYWVCNTEVYSRYTGFHYVGFAMDDQNKGYAILWDKDENEIIRPL